MATTVRGRVGAGLLAWVGALAVVAAAAHPESCPTVSAEEVRAAAQAGADWVGTNQAVDGRFLYRYDRAEQEAQPGYNYVRHAGMLLALEQGAAAGLAGAAETAAAGFEFVGDHLTELPDGRTAFTADTGGTGLLVAALVERRRRTGDESNDELLTDLGRFLEGTVTDEGAIIARWDLETDEPVSGTRSPFFTGEILWALARLNAEFPDDDWNVAARRVSTYLATERDDAERRFPPVSEHWGAYAWDEIAAWPAPLTEDELAYAERQAGLFGLQVRYESQRRESGLARLTRGPHALPSGLGTIGEGLGGIRRLARRESRLDVDQEDLDDRLTCVAGMLVERQTHSDDPRLDGAWFRADDVTQLDDQQHAVSALLAALPVLEDTP
ncbi:MAG TPA: hypothetical protein VIT24_10490 [Acidimicrobiales bacterium]